MKNWENFINNKSLTYVCITFVCIGLGGFFSEKFLHLNLVIGLLIGAMAATLIIFVIAPNFEHKVRTNPSGQQIKQPSRPELKDLQVYLHPTRRHTLIGFLWSFLLVFFFVPIFEKKGENTPALNLIFVLLLLFISLDGYQMVKRNVRIGRHGHLIHGAGSQYIGYMILFFCWSGCIIIILTMIFGW